MMTLEARRSAARSLRRHQPAPGFLVLLCFRCGREFKSALLARHCHVCNAAALKAFGSPHPTMEASGT